VNYIIKINNVNELGNKLFIFIEQLKKFAIFLIYASKNRFILL